MSENQSNRDLRLDLFRGLANWAIFLDHVPNNLIAWVTARNYGFSDAAELFIFISGFTVAFVYGRMMTVKGFIAASVGLLGRVWKIYVAYLLLFMFYVVAVGYVAQRFGHAHLLDEFNIRRLIADPIEYMKHGMLLEYRPLNLDVLPLYAVLMALFPPFLRLLMFAPNVALALAVGLYITARQLGWNLSGYPSGQWYFNPFAWQLLFAIGAWAAIVNRNKLRSILRFEAILPICIAFLVFSAVVTIAARTGNDGLLPISLREVFIPNDKTNLAPYRILHFVALAVVVTWLVPKDAQVLNWRVWRPLVVCGQQSLEVFCAGVFLAFLAYFAIDLVSESFSFQLVISAGGIMAMTGVAYFRRWAKTGGSRSLKRGAVTEG